jgi:hypothetical protein
MHGVIKRGADIFVFEVGVVVKDLLPCRAGGQQIQDIADTDAHATDARSAAANACGKRDPGSIDIRAPFPDSMFRCWRASLDLESTYA